MKRKSNGAVSCPNVRCKRHGERNGGNIAMHGFSKVKWGKRRRYRCTACPSDASERQCRAS